MCCLELVNVVIGLVLLVVVEVDGNEGKYCSESGQFQVKQLVVVIQGIDRECDQFGEQQFGGLVVGVQGKVV